MTTSLRLSLTEEGSKWRGEGDSNSRENEPTGLAIQRNGQAMRSPLVVAATSEPVIKMTVHHHADTISQSVRSVSLSIDWAKWTK